MNNFKDYFNMLPNAADNLFRMKQHAIQEALLQEAKKKSKKADKDYDGDGKIESGSEEYLGSRNNAIKKAIAKRKGEKVEESFEPELTDVDLVEDLFEEVFSGEDLDGEDLNLLEQIILEKKKWIQAAIKKPGALRKSLKAKEGKNIPMSKLEKAAKKGGKMGKRARLALTLKKLRSKKD